MTGTRRRAALAPVLIFASMVVALISSLGAPLLPSISTHMHVALSAAQWSLTITLLVGTVSSPIMGRLGDGPHRREMIIAGLSTVTAGGVVAALASSLPVLVAGRGLQGIGLGLVPLAMTPGLGRRPPPRTGPGARSWPRMAHARGRPPRGRPRSSRHGSRKHAGHELDQVSHPRHDKPVNLKEEI